MSVAVAPELRTIPSAALGAPGAPDPARCSLVAIEALARSSGEGFQLSSLAMEVASHAISPAEEVEVRTKIDKRTRSIVFASVEAWIGPQLVFIAQGLFAGRSVKD